MAFVSKLGNILKQSVGVSKNVSSGLSVSSPSIFQAVRCMSSKLFIGGLSYQTDEQSLREAFSSFGEVLDSRVIMDRETGRSRGFGFIEFASQENAQSAIQAMDQQELHSRRIRVNFATDRSGGFRSGGGGGYGGGGGGYGGGSGGGNYGGAGFGGDSYGSGGGGGYGGSSGGGGYGGSSGGGGYNSGSSFDGGATSGGYASGSASGYGGSGGEFGVATGGASGGEFGVATGGASGGGYAGSTGSGGYGQNDALDDEPEDFADKRG